MAQNTVVPHTRGLGRTRRFGCLLPFMKGGGAPGQGEPQEGFRVLSVAPWNLAELT